MAWLHHPVERDDVLPGGHVAEFHRSVLESGARAAVNRETPDLGEAVREAAGGELDVVADVVGGALVALALP
ncbi:MAG: hypothetical protein CMF56_07085 [Leifsonia sp.]|nr:hypothetical protein [Leifsonia sp.]